MKKAFLLFLFVAGLTAQAFAYPLELVLLPREEVVRLSDAKLTEAYVEVLVELDAMKAFHMTSGFHPREYRDFKSLLRYRLWMALEMQKRKIKFPEIQ